MDRARAFNCVALSVSDFLGDGNARTLSHRRLQGGTGIALSREIDGETCRADDADDRKTQHHRNIAALAARKAAQGLHARGKGNAFLPAGVATAWYGSRNPGPRGGFRGILSKLAHDLYNSVIPNEITLSPTLEC